VVGAGKKASASFRFPGGNFETSADTLQGCCYPGTGNTSGSTLMGMRGMTSGGTNLPAAELGVTVPEEEGGREQRRDFTGSSEIKRMGITLRIDYRLCA